MIEKGLPYGEEFAPGRWNLAGGDLPMPAMVLRESALAHNIATMAAWCDARGLALAPHGKTTMCPQLWHRQTGAGAWGITVATVTQAMVALEAGIARVLIANQVADACNVRTLARAANRFPAADILCLADSETGVTNLATGLQRARLEHPIGVLLEFGRPGWRTGVRNREAAQAVRRTIGAFPGCLRFRGVEGFEGSAGETAQAVDFLGEMLLATADFHDAATKPIYSIGGSVFLAPVAAALARAGQGWSPLLRSGCYVTHDHGFYAVRQQAAIESAADVPVFQPAIELWACVQSLPDPATAILTFGKRDCAYDLGLPVPLDLPGATVTGLNDQHAFLNYVAGTRPEVGQLLRFGISHPCTAFDKWRAVPVVDDEYRVIDIYRTCF